MNKRDVVLACRLNDSICYETPAVSGFGASLPAVEPAAAASISTLARVDAAEKSAQLATAYPKRAAGIRARKTR
jgi:hypothetical protein